ncbi:hypothetical protein [Psychrilyobacter sp.]|uniref:hypothetical protein n=1 Tax=Psychrilyobacter sp. TaxID=2586924 RepID=UPI003016C121
MRKKQILFWRTILILIVIFGIFFIIKNISEDKKQNIDNNEKTVEKKIELKIRPDDFYKQKKDEN